MSPCCDAWLLALLGCYPASLVFYDDLLLWALRVMLLSSFGNVLQCCCVVMLLC